MPKNIGLETFFFLEKFIQKKKKMFRNYLKKIKKNVTNFLYYLKKKKLNNLLPNTLRIPIKKIFPF